jgi:hypothetical protein
MTLDFPAKVYVASFEDEVLTVAFADSEDADPDRYLILQRGASDDAQDAELGMDTYYAEIGEPGLAGYGGIDAVQISADALVFAFSTTTPWCRDIGRLRIALQPSLGELGDIEQSLKTVLAERPTALHRTQ